MGDFTKFHQFQGNLVEMGGFWGILPQFQHLDVEIGLWRARGADSNKTYAFLRCFEGSGAAEVSFLVDFHQNGGFGVHFR